jgi:L-ascorbate metabolism protein UlaG (beta-lactamase superfamily)
VTPRPRPGAISRLTESLRTKAAGLRDGTGSQDDEHGHRIGLSPSPGWGRRNVEFIGKVLLPHVVKPRRGRERVLEVMDVPAGKARIVWIGHASFLVQMAGLNILIDPVWAPWLAVVKRAHAPGLTLHELPRIDLVLVSHAHHDHLDVPTLEAISDGQPILVPKGVGSLVKRRGFGTVHEMNKWEAVRVGELEISFTPARHWGARYVHDVHRGFGGFLLRQPEVEALTGGAGTTVYHSGDSAYFDGFHEIGQRHPIDVALIPIGAYRPVSGRGVHMTPEESLAAFRDLGAKRMVPMHYGTYPLTREPLDEPLDRLMLASSASGIRHLIDVLEPGEPKVY